ncbi:hypothetical protein BRADI_4g37290v3 [Brachypodium distachyon]|uniref:KIB1-4 beta-propeller domain-containing protein n=1 Tax=Brachypodium distachyon TaxID=15368 RepID=I1ISL2_BRADI|nr:hypothetical protein BRADI_4g37290v3 [Brachypodium distachyon]
MTRRPSPRTSLPAKASQPARRRSRRLQVDWRALPKDLVEFIAGKLPSARDACAFRVVCRAWYFALSFAKTVAPVLLLPFNPYSTEDAATFYRMTADKGDGKFFTRNGLSELRGKVMCGSSRGWLALADEVANVKLLNPFNGATADLPPGDERVAAASWRAVSMVVEADGGRRRWLRRYPDGSDHPVGLNSIPDVFFREIVLSSHPGSGRCVAMAVLAFSSTVAFCRVGVDHSWKLLHTKMICRIGSVIYCPGRNRFLAIGTGGVSICHVSGRTPTARPVPSLTDRLPRQIIPRSYLQLDGELHLVGTVSATGSTYCYKCNVFARTPAWSRVRNSPDMTLFVSNKFTVGTGGASVSGFKKDSIYFPEHINRYYAAPAGRRRHHELEIINITEGTSELQAYREKSPGSSDALCWIQPNPWARNA